jgi:hypothetical protein
MNKNTMFLCLSSCLAWVNFASIALGADEHAKDSWKIKIENYSHKETLRYPVVLLQGTLAPEATEIVANNESSSRDNATQTGLVENGRFKVLAELCSGKNKIVLKSREAFTEIELTFQPQTNRHYIRAIYLTDSTGETNYQTPLEHDAQDYVGKLDTLLKLLQTFTAEGMHQLGFGRQTFNLEYDEQGKVKVHVIAGREKAEHYYRLNDQQWFREIQRELGEKMPDPLAKDFVVAAYSRFDPKLKKTLGHTALGGGRQGLFGSGNMFTWPSSLAEVQPRFLDDRRIDAANYQDDSAGRNTYWGAASTTMGACLHELGHALDLPHTRKPLDIMTRGFDHLNRAFTFADPASGVNRREVKVTPENTARFEPISAASFVSHPWFALDNRPDPNSAPQLKIRYDDHTQQWIFDSQTKLTFVGMHQKGEALSYVVPKQEDAQHVVIEIKQIPDWKPGEMATVRIVDALGNIEVHSLHERKSESKE